jgi:hypothetical protein
MDKPIRSTRLEKAKTFAKSKTTQMKKHLSKVGKGIKETGKVARSGYRVLNMEKDPFRGTIIRK